MNIITPYDQRLSRERELFQVGDTYAGVVGDYGHSTNGSGYPLYQTEAIPAFYNNNHVSYGYDESGEVMNTCHCAGVTHFDESSQNVYPVSVGFRDAAEGWRVDDDAYYNGQNASSRVYEDSANYPGNSSASQIPEFIHISETGHIYEPPSSLIQGEGSISMSSFTSEDSYRPPTLSSQPLLPQIPLDVQFVPLSSSLNQNCYPATIPLPLSPAPADDNQGSLTSVLPDQHSNYSELSANLVYLASLSEPQGSIVIRNKRSINVDRRRREKGPSTKPREKQYRRIAELTDTISEVASLIPQMDWTGVASTSTPTSSVTPSSTSEAVVEGAQIQLQLPVRTPTSIRGGGNSNGNGGSHNGQLTSNKPLARQSQTKQIPPPAGIGKSTTGSSTSGSGTGTSTGKKLGLACLFCRERKIACGRPAESHPDQRCNQCARRAFKCEYPTESRRGQHKRPKAKPGVT